MTKDLLKKKGLTPEYKEQGLTYLKDKYKVSHARACKIVSCPRTKKYYKRVMPDKDAPIREAIMILLGSSRRPQEGDRDVAKNVSSMERLVSTDDKRCILIKLINEVEEAYRQIFSAGKKA
jgi:hypothetical protein